MWQPAECCYHWVLHRDVRGSGSFVPSQCRVWVRWMMPFASCWPFGLGCICYWWCCLQNGCLERLFFDWVVCAVVWVVSRTTVFLTGLSVLLSVLCPNRLFWLGCLCCCRCCVHNDCFELVVCAVKGAVSTTTFLNWLSVLLKMLCPERLFWIGCLCGVFCPEVEYFWLFDLNDSYHFECWIECSI